MNKPDKWTYLVRLLMLGLISLIAISIFQLVSLVQWVKKNQPKTYSYKAASKLCRNEVKARMSDPAQKGDLDGRHDWRGKPIAKETYPGEFTIIVDIRCEELPGQQQGDQGSIYGIAYILTRGTAEAPPKLDPVTITSGYRFDRRIKQD
jgi:hypothetical protein